MGRQGLLSAASGRAAFLQGWKGLGVELRKATARRQASTRSTRKTNRVIAMVFAPRSASFPPFSSASFGHVKTRYPRVGPK